MAKANKERETQITTLEVLEELTPDEQRERTRLEWRVERAFYEAGVALRSLRDKRLYRSTHYKFEDYCFERFHFSRDKADLMIKAVGVVDNLKNDDNCRRFLPTAESQIRDIANLSPTAQCQIYAQAVDEAGRKVPTRRIVKGIVERLKEKPLFVASDFCCIGDVFTLTRLEGEERRYNGYPCIALVLKDFTIVVDVYDATLTVKPENLKPIDEPDVRRQLPTTIKRIKRVRNVGLLDRGAYSMLEHLGRQTYLTDFEDKLLNFLETEHGIEPNS